jgi:hypothetical protein
MNIMNGRDRIKDELQARFPDWQIWYVPGAGRTTWHARPHPLLSADSPEELARQIEQHAAPSQ